MTETSMSDNVLLYSPLRGIKPLMKNQAPRESFTLQDDAKKILFDCKWKNEAHRTFNFLAALTGMRLREIHSIRKENLHETYIDLKDQFLNGKLRPLKTKESRKIPLCPELYKLLKDRMGIKYIFEDVAVTIPYKKDKRSRFYFERNDKTHLNQLKTIRFLSFGKKTFLGEWHTHPEKIPTPSSLDLAEWKKTIDANDEVLLFLIIGQKEIFIKTSD